MTDPRRRILASSTIVSLMAGAALALPQAAQTQDLVKDINPTIVPGSVDPASTEGSSPRSLVDAYGRTFFVADDGTHGPSLWVSDGTEPGTRMVKDVHPAHGLEEPLYLMPFRDKLLFSGDSPSGYELYISDGTDAGTLLLKDIYPGSTSSNPKGFVVCGRWAMFTAVSPGYGREPWVTDGTAAGTMLLADVRLDGGSDVRTAVRVGDKLFFIATEPINYDEPGNTPGPGELWVTDGTPGGTSWLLDLPEELGAFGPNELVPVGDRVCFRGYSSTTGYELWVSDGTVAGTALLHDAWANLNSAYPDEMVAALGGVAYVCHDGLHGRELWLSDGTPAGSALLKDIRAGSVWSSPADLTPVGSDLLFFTADDGVSGRELWASDGTAAGTVLLKDILPGLHATRLGGLVPVGTDRLFFTADDGVHGQELWVSDGTPAGTMMVMDIGPGSSGSYPQWMLAVGSRRVIFSANDGIGPVFGFRTWASDGTPAGTTAVSEMAFFQEATLSNGQVMFTADGGLKGSELWSYDPGATSKEVGYPSGLTWPRLRSTEALIGGTWELAVEGGPPSTFGYLALSGPATPISLFMPARLALDNEIYVDLLVASASPLIHVTTDVNGDWNRSIPVPAGLSPMPTICIQGVLINGPRWDLTNGVHLTVGH